MFSTFNSYFDKLRVNNRGSRSYKFRQKNNRKATRGRRIQEIKFKDGTSKFIVHSR